MALQTPSNFQFLIILAAVLIPVAAAAAAYAPPATTVNNRFKSQSTATVLSSLGFRQLATVAAQSLPNTTVPLTIFAPSDSSILTCPSCSLPLLLLEHSIPSLYPISLLLSLPFGTKIQTLSPHLRCLTLTSSRTGYRTAFVSGVEITRSELFRNDRLMIHGIQGFLSHLSPLSCNVESMTSLAFPDYPTPFSPFFMMRLMLKDAMLRLRISGYSVLALAMREKYKELLELRAATIFALDDESIFSKGQVYVRDLRFHIVPNRRLTARNLVMLPSKAVLPTMDPAEEKLVVTTAGGGGLLELMRINYVKVRNLELVLNARIAVHGVTEALKHDPTAGNGLSKNEGSGYEGNAIDAEADDYHHSDKPR